MRLPIHILTLLSGLMLLMAGCDTVDPAEVRSQVFVESYQVANQPLADIRLSRTAHIDAQYNFNSLAIRGATVRVLLLRPDGSVEQTYDYAEKPKAPGIYVYSGTATVLPLRTYRLEVTAGSEQISATTTIPGQPRLVLASADTVRYLSSEQLELRVTKSDYPGRQAIFIFTGETLDPKSDNLVPVARQLFDDGDIDVEDLLLVSSPPLNEANYTANPDGTLTIRMPWLMVYFYGPIRASMSAIDNNMYDFARSFSVQQGGSTLSPGELPNIIEHVEGGTGVFGSYAKLSHDVFVLPQ